MIPRVSCEVKNNSTKVFTVNEKFWLYLARRRPNYLYTVNLYYFYFLYVLESMNCVPVAEWWAATCPSFPLSQDRFWVLQFCLLCPQIGAQSPPSRRLPVLSPPDRLGLHPSPTTEWPAGLSQSTLLPWASISSSVKWRINNTHLTEQLKKSNETMNEDSLAQSLEISTQSWKLALDVSHPWQIQPLTLFLYNAGVQREDFPLLFPECISHAWPSPFREAGLPHLPSLGSLHVRLHLHCLGNVNPASSEDTSRGQSPHGNACVWVMLI